MIMSLALEVLTPPTEGTTRTALPEPDAGSETFGSVKLTVLAPEMPKTEASAAIPGAPLQFTVVVTFDNVPLATPYHSSSSMLLAVNCTVFRADPCQAMPAVDKD